MKFFLSLNFDTLKIFQPLQLHLTNRQNPNQHRKESASFRPKQKQRHV
jgi:hypothetical protein